VTPRVALAAALLAAAGAAPAYGAEAAPDTRPSYEMARQDEDWSALRDTSLRTDPFDPIKFVPLDATGAAYLTLGGELRERFEAVDHGLFGLGAPGRDTYALHRLYLFGDLHLSPALRLFGEVASGSVGGFEGIPPATQKDRLDLLQGLVDVTLPVPGGVTVRAGRQEMSFGSSRLVSVRESPNIHRAFDGVRATWEPSPTFKLDVFATRPVENLFGSFDDRRDRTQAFWGAYATVAAPILGSKLDVYYLGLKREDADFAQGLATERRHTVGARLFGKRDGFDWNVEAAGQFGTFGRAKIRAWTVSSNAGYTFEGAPFSPRLGLNADAISGDRDLGDRTLGTFNPLFPKLPYFSEANLAAPANLLDIQPNLTLSVTPELSVTVGWNPLWKFAKADAFYAPPFRSVDDTAGGSARFIGQQLVTAAEWQATEHVTIGGSYVYFAAGDRLRDAGGRSGQFTTAWTKFVF
jgi:hypothetical protein